jgi:hypothetical protein
VFLRCYGYEEFLVGDCQHFEGEGTVEAAGIGKHPYGCSAEAGGLSAPREFALVEECCAGWLSQEGEIAWAVSADLALEPGTGFDEVSSVEIAGADCGSFDRRGEAAAVVEQHAGFFGIQLSGREPSEMNDSPEAIGSICEVISELG